MHLYNPQTLSKRTFKQTLSTLPHLGVQRIWGRNRLLVASNRNTQCISLVTFLKELLKSRDIYLAFSTGTPGYYRKTTAQIMSRDGRILAYAKIGDTLQAKKMLTQEAEMLRCLSKLSISTGRIPELIYAGYFNKSELLLQTAPSGKTRSGAGKLGGEHIGFLAELFNQTKVQKVLVESEYWIRINREFKLLQNRIDRRWRRRIQSGLDICERIFADGFIPLGVCHRDFAPWNTLVGQRGLYVFDWEYAVAEGIPFWDLFHFVFFPAILVRRRSGRQILDQWGSNDIKQQLRLYAKKIDVDARLVPAFFLLYLIEASCFHLDVFHHDGIQNRQREWLRKTWAEILDEMTDHWKLYWSCWQ